MMSIENQYRTSSNWKEIIKIVEKSSHLPGNFIWQNTGEDRVLRNIQQLEVLPELNTMKIHLADEPDGLTLHQPAYLKLTFRDTIFKVNVLNIIGNVVSIVIPEEVKAKELRANPRTKFKPKDGKRVSMSLAVGIMSKSAATLDFQVIDLSEKGMSIVVSDENLEMIKNSPKILLDKLGTFDLTFKIPVELVYAHRLRYRYKGSIIKGNRVGFRFQDKLKKSFIDNFSMTYD
jgi:hypothetical protein